MAREILKGLTLLMLVVGLALVSAVAANGQQNTPGNYSCSDSIVVQRLR